MSAQLCYLTEPLDPQGRVLAPITPGAPQTKSLSTYNRGFGVLGAHLWVRERGKDSGSDP